MLPDVHGADPTALPVAILASVPGTMRELAQHVGVGGEVLWQTVRAMRRAGFLHRGAKRIYELGKKPMPDDWQLDPEALDAARKASASNAGSGGRRTATVLVSVPGFPPQDPGRTLIFDTVINQREADAELRRLMKNIPAACWSVERLTAWERRRIKNKPVPHQAGNDTDAA
jgi:hypothetical protein